ncbi:MAG: DUF3458 domain-containing protein, partial [Pseudomonadota bacterium]
SRAGTPRLRVDETWDETAGTLSLTFRQSMPIVPGQDDAAPMVIPVALGLLGTDGSEVRPTEVIALDEPERTVRFRVEGGRPTASILRGFSAPVILERDLDDAARAFLLAHDTDPFNRWEAGRRYAMSLILGRLGAEADPIPEEWSAALGRVLVDEGLDPAFRALTLELPSNDEVAGELASRGERADPNAIHDTLTEMRAHLGRSLAGPLETTIAALEDQAAYSPDAAAAGRRALRNRCLGLLLAAGEEAAHRATEAQFDRATNMTDSLAALSLLVHHATPGAGPRLAAFRERWSADELVMDKWFTVQATSPAPGAVERAGQLTEDPAFNWKRPNRFRSVIAAFAMGNPVGFHAADGTGYRFVADWLIRLDGLNPQTAARVTGCFESWRRYTEDRQAAMRSELERIAAIPSLSRNTREIVERLMAA